MLLSKVTSRRGSAYGANWDYVPLSGAHWRMGIFSLGLSNLELISQYMCYQIEPLSYQKPQCNVIHMFLNQLMVWYLFFDSSSQFMGEPKIKKGL